jgi:hypothetical protein
MEVEIRDFYRGFYPNAFQNGAVGKKKYRCDTQYGAVLEYMTQDLGADG